MRKIAADGFCACFAAMAHGSKETFARQEKGRHVRVSCIFCCKNMDTFLPPFVRKCLRSVSSVGCCVWADRTSFPPLGAIWTATKAYIFFFCKTRLVLCLHFSSRRNQNPSMAQSQPAAANGMKRYLVLVGNSGAGFVFFLFPFQFLPFFVA